MTRADTTNTQGTRGSLRDGVHYERDGAGGVIDSNYTYGFEGMEGVVAVLGPGPGPNGQVVNNNINNNLGEVNN